MHFRLNNRTLGRSFWQQPLHAGFECRKIIVDDFSHDVEVYVHVIVGDTISHADDVRPGDVIVFVLKII